LSQINTDVLIIGTGPAGSASAALLSSYGIDNMVINRYRWLANSPRAHITNQRTMEVLRDLGNEVEAEAYMHATDQELMGTNVFCESLSGEELGRLQTWGNHPNSKAEHLLSSPTFMNDLPQTFMEPLLFKTACSRGTQARMSCEYQNHIEDEEGVLTTILDRLTNEKFTVRSKYLIGADGGNSKVVENTGLPIEGEMAIAGSINFLFKADLTKYVAHRPSVLYWVMQPGSNVGGIGMGVVRMVRPWNEWLAIWGYDINGPRPELSDNEAKEIIRDLVGDRKLDIDLQGVSYWTNNDAYATQLSKGRVFIMGDAAHRHPPSNGLGSNTSIQDAFNLCWKMALVLKGQAGETLLESYNVERAPIAKQIVTRANKSIGEFGPIFEALGLIGHTDPEIMKANMIKRCNNDEQAAEQRRKLREAIAFKKYEFDAHGVEMNQRYDSTAIFKDGQPDPGFVEDEELHYQPTTWPGARIPHIWLFENSTGKKVSTLDLTGKGKFSIITGIGGEDWLVAAKEIEKDTGIFIRTVMIGPRHEIADHTGDWARASDISDNGCLLVRPDQHIAWRAHKLTENPTLDMYNAIKLILGLN
jgi:2,4-dichlorophenol 6-monooxygenase